MGHRIVLTTFGSLGDLHPFIAVALGLRERGHHPVIATVELFREKIESLGIEFHRIRYMRAERPDARLMKQAMDLRNGPEFVVRQIVMPCLKDAYEDTLAAAKGADLLVSHSLTYPTRLIAEKLGLPWASFILQPVSFFSACDPPVLAPAPFLAHLRFLGPAFFRPLFRLAKWHTRGWSKPWHQLRSDIGLGPTQDEPVMDGQHSPHLVLALFSPLFARKQPDWPPQSILTGFSFHDTGRR